uniref:Uncharacterized protein n=1 Tax=Ditylenchus dipsaci TaxID=166011 RepID=A0A915E361_9BILA
MVAEFVKRFHTVLFCHFVCLEEEYSNISIYKSLFAGVCCRILATDYPPIRLSVFEYFTVNDKTYEQECLDAGGDLNYWLRQTGFIRVPESVACTDLMGVQTVPSSASSTNQNTVRSNQRPKLDFTSALVPSLKRVSDVLLMLCVCGYWCCSAFPPECHILRYISGGFDLVGSVHASQTKHIQCHQTFLDSLLRTPLLSHIHLSNPNGPRRYSTKRLSCKTDWSDSFGQFRVHKRFSVVGAKSS